MSKVLILLFLFALAFTGCAPKIQTEYIYKDVYVPVKCNAKMPIKPTNDESFESHKQKMLYFLRTEALLKECIGANDESN